MLTLHSSGSGRVIADWFGTSAAKGNIDLVTESGWTIYAHYPAPATADVPEHTPTDIARLYKQAHSAKSRGEREAAGFIFGKVLEISLKLLDSSIKGPLAARIDKLAEARVISDDVRKWAHEIRIVRNDAVHEADEPSVSDIDEAAEFVEAFLTFVFTMPRKYELRASRKASA